MENQNITTQEKARLVKSVVYFNIFKTDLAFYRMEEAMPLWLTPFYLLSRVTRLGYFKSTWWQYLLKKVAQKFVQFLGHFEKCQF